MLKPLSSARHGFKAVALSVLLGAAAAYAQHGTAPQTKPVGHINFGTNGSDPEGTRDPNVRILQGKVQDPDGKAIKGAVVYLKDKKDASMRSVVVDDNGTFRFVQLPKNHDYEVWAQNEKKKGILKAISSFDDRVDINMNLKIE
jgi:hypothetical protein